MRSQRTIHSSDLCSNTHIKGHLHVRQSRRWTLCSNLYLHTRVFLNVCTGNRPRHCLRQDMVSSFDPACLSFSRHRVLELTGGMSTALRFACCRADYILEMRDISVDESEELPQILHPLVNDGPPALAGRNAAVSPASRCPAALLSCATLHSCMRAASRCCLLSRSADTAWHETDHDIARSRDKPEADVAHVHNWFR